MYLKHLLKSLLYHLKLIFYNNPFFQELYPDAQPSAGNAESSTESVNGELKNYKAHNQFNDSEFASENILSGFQNTNENQEVTDYGPMPKITRI